MHIFLIFSAYKSKVCTWGYAVTINLIEILKILQDSFKSAKSEDTTWDSSFNTYSKGRNVLKIIPIPQIPLMDWNPKCWNQQINILNNLTKAKYTIWVILKLYWWRIHVKRYKSRLLWFELYSNVLRVKDMLNLLTGLPSHEDLTNNICWKTSYLT